MCSGHPFPLKGSYYASIFIHFEPTGHTLGKNKSGYFYVKDEDAPSNGRKSDRSMNDVSNQYRKDVESGFGGQSSSYGGGLPPYIKRQSPEEDHWLVFHPGGWTPVSMMILPILSFFILLSKTRLCQNNVPAARKDFTSRSPHCC